MKSYLERMESCRRSGDQEEAHYAADALLLEIVREAGYDDVADVYIEIDKWYS